MEIRPAYQVVTGRYDQEEAERPVGLPLHRRHRRGRPVGAGDGCVAGLPGKRMSYAGRLVACLTCTPFQEQLYRKPNTELLLVYASGMLRIPVLSPVTTATPFTVPLA